MTVSVKRQVRARDAGRCVRCGGRGRELVFRKPKRHGGTTTVANMQTMCAGCETWRDSNPADAFMDGFLAPYYASDVTWPGCRAGVGWVVYYDRPDVDGAWWQILTESTAEFLMGRGRT